jgi:hypothetical protein
MLYLAIICVVILLIILTVTIKTIIDVKEHLTCRHNKARPAPVPAPAPAPAIQVPLTGVSVGGFSSVIPDIKINSGAIFNIRTKAYIANICGNQSFPDKQAVKETFFKQYSSKEHVTLELYFEIVTYGHKLFTEQNNTIHDTVFTIRNSICSPAQPESQYPNDKWDLTCNTRDWLVNIITQLASFTTIDSTSTPVVLLPNQTACPFAAVASTYIFMRGGGPVTYSTGKGQVLYFNSVVHETMHLIFKIGPHSAAVCGAYKVSGYGTSANAECDGDGNYVDEGGLSADNACLMGYGGGRFFNVARAHQELQIVYPIFEINRSQGHNTVRITVPALELTNINHVYIYHPDFPNRAYYISYHKQADNKFIYKGTNYKGYFDLDDYHGTVHVHMWQSDWVKIGSKRTKGSYLLKVFKQGGPYTIAKPTNNVFPDNVGLDGFTVTCTQIYPDRADIIVTY